jgi:hypothetical protein
LLLASGLIRMQVETPALRSSREAIPVEKALLVFSFSLLAFAAYLFVRPADIQVTLEMSSTAPGAAQIFYNIGHGFNQTDSETVRITSTSLDSFQELTFDLPNLDLLNLRFDPLIAKGSFKIRKIAIRNSGLALQRIALSDVVPLNHVPAGTQQGSELLFSISPALGPPHLAFKLHGPLRVDQRIFSQNLRLVIFAAGLLCAGVILGVWPPRSLRSFVRAPATLVRRIDSSFRRFAQRLSSPEFMQFDSYAIWFYFACLVLFLCASLADLNGSSIAMYSSAYGHGAPQKIWLGAPRPSRSDEWSYSTPDILNQSLRAHRFRTGDSALGGHSVALVGNIPVRHFSTVFRPQFWAFFLLPVDYAFAVFWQCKALILLTGVFTWLLLITRSTFWAATGSLWYFFSPFTQWAYSWPTGLPEMVGLVCFIMVLTCYLTVGRNKVALFSAAFAAAACAINFALCAYLPHMVPLFWLAVFFFLGWCVYARRLILTRPARASRILALTLAVCIVGGVGLSVFIHLRPALIAIANTSYPGMRVFPPQNTLPFLFTTHFMQWTETERSVPPVLGNLSEGSGFLWLAPATLFCFRRMTLSAMQKFVLGSLWAFSCLILAWLLLPVPAVLGKILALDRTAGPRTFLALGLANVGIVALTAASTRRFQFRNTGTALAYYACVAGLCSAILFFALRATNEKLGLFFTMGAVLFATFFVAGLITLLVSGRKVGLALALVIPQALLFGTVNPVERGVGVFTSSELYKFVRRNPELLNGKWILFSGAVVGSAFLAATGCDVYTGDHYLPDIDHFPLFAQTGLDPAAFNRLGYLDAHPIPPNEKTSVEFFVPVVRWKVSPADPILPQIGIRYVAFDQPPPAAWVSKLVPISSRPIDGFWLYRFQ